MLASRLRLLCLTALLGTCATLCYPAKKAATGLPAMGYAWSATSGEITALVIGDEGTHKGDLYLWRRHGDPTEGSLRKVALQGQALSIGMEWAPGGNALAFFEELDGKPVLCCLAGYEAQEISANPIVWKAFAKPVGWSHGSRYLAFIERTGTGTRLRCLPCDLAIAKNVCTKDEVFDMPSVPNYDAKCLIWSPDISSVLVEAWAENGEIEPGIPRISKPALFVTYPSTAKKKATVIWQDPNLKQRIPDAYWADGGRKVVFALVEPGCYDIAQSLHVVNNDGSGLRKLWSKSFAYLAVRGQVALLWLLPDGWGDSPEPTRMAAINIKTGKTKMYQEGMVALSPGVTISSSSGATGTQEFRWSKDGRTLSMLVYGKPELDKYRRVTIRLP